MSENFPEGYQRLQHLLTQCQADGIAIEFWWRDDDARIFGPKLADLYAISHDTKTPLCLAVIPTGADDSLLRQAPENMYIFQHGVEHRQYQETGAKKCEFPGNRGPGDMKKALITGKKQLKTLFADQFLPCMTPPWNRFPNALKPLLQECGFTHLSRYNSPDPQDQVPGIQNINTHVDIINWKTRSFLGWAESYDLVCQHVQQRLQNHRHNLDQNLEPIGILSHHMDHDPNCDAFLRQLFNQIHTHPAASWLSGQEIMRR